MASAGGTSTAKVSKLMERLDNAIQSKKFYEAHQLYKTLYFRCTTRRQYQEAAQHMMAGAKLLLENKQTESGADLANLLLKSYIMGELTLTSDTVSDFQLLYKLMKAGSRERSDFVASCTQLLKSSNSKTCIAETAGAEKDSSSSSSSMVLYHNFNLAVGRVLWHEMNYEEARYHLMRSDDGFSTGCMLVDFHLRSGFRSEIDLFIGQAVLQLLCAQKLPAAGLTFYTYTRRHPNLEPGPPYTARPLLNFLWFLMLALQRGAGVTVFTVLVDRYQGALMRDPAYPCYLERIGQIYYGITKDLDGVNDSEHGGSLMNNLFNMLTNGMNSEDMSETVPEEMD